MGSANKVLLERDYEPPISSRGPDIRSWTPRTILAPGVLGYSYRRGKEIFIPLIAAESEASGDVGRFLDRLSPRCVIIDVVSDRLRGMLLRRGFQMRQVGISDEWRRNA